MVIIECIGLKPNCKLYRHSLCSRKEYGLLWRSFSIILPIIDNNEMG